MSLPPPDAKKIRCCIYKITNPKGRVYIGQTVNFWSRYRTYRACHSSVRYQTKLFNSFQKYGFNAHKFEIVTICAREELNALEKSAIDAHGSTGKSGLNCLGGGDSLHSQSKETIEKRASKMRGRICSKETKLKIGTANAGIRNGMHGRPSVNKGVFHTAKTVAKCKANVFVSYHRLGTKHTKETLRLISERTLGKNTGPSNPRFMGYIVAYSLSGDFVGRYPGLNAASVALGVDFRKISAVVLGCRRQSGGFVFHREPVFLQPPVSLIGSTVYLSGPMSGLPDFNRPAFFAAEDALLASGAVKVFNPARHPPGLSWEEYMRRDLDWLRVCLKTDRPILARLPDWWRSRGATVENDLWSLSGEITIDLPFCSFSCRLLAG